MLDSLVQFVLGQFRRILNVNHPLHQLLLVFTLNVALDDLFLLGLNHFSARNANGAVEFGELRFLLTEDGN